MTQPFTIKTEQGNFYVEDSVVVNSKNFESCIKTTYKVIKCSIGYTTPDYYAEVIEVSNHGFPIIIEIYENSKK